MFDIVVKRGSRVFFCLVEVLREIENLEVVDRLEGNVGFIIDLNKISNQLNIQYEVLVYNLYICIVLEFELRFMFFFLIYYVNDFFVNCRFKLLL